MGGMVKGKSDPYVKIRVGGIAFKSQVIKENLNPTWNELYEVCMLIYFVCNMEGYGFFLKTEGFHLDFCFNSCFIPPLLQACLNIYFRLCKLQRVNAKVMHTCLLVLQVILTQLPGQEVEFDLYDKDIDQDDFLGR